MIKHCLKRCCIIGGKSFIFLFSFLFMCSCTDFFSNSLAPWAARDPSRLVPDVTLDNVDDLIALAENNPDLSLAVLKKIAEATKKASGGNKAALQSAAVQAAVNAVGMGQSIIGSAGEISSLTDDEEAAKNAIVDAINGKPGKNSPMPNLEESSASLFALLPDRDSEELGIFVETASAEDIAMAAILLLAGEAKKSGNPGYYIDVFDENSSEETALALDLVKYLDESGRENELPDSLQNILSGLNLKK